VDICLRMAPRSVEESIFHVVGPRWRIHHLAAVVNKLSRDHVNFPLASGSAQRIPFTTQHRYSMPGGY